MARTTKPLTPTEVLNAKPDLAKQKRLFDGKGLFLLISPKGGKWWRFKYQFQGKANILSFGTYPEVSLANARDYREAARKQVAAGIDPSGVRKAQKAAILAENVNSFEVVAREWHSKFSSRWSESHSETTIGRLKLNVFPFIGNRPIGEITALELLAMLRHIESRGALETAHRVQAICGQIFRYAIVTGRADRDLSADLKGSLPPYTQGHHAAIIAPKEVGSLLTAIDGYRGTSVVRSALQLSPYVFVRPGELRYAEWKEIDLDAAEWDIPAERMKGKVAHLVPLSHQAVKIIKELRTITGTGRFLFPGLRSTSKPMSENAVNAALRYMDFDKNTMTGHGFRAMARTMIRQNLYVLPEYIELQLSHVTKSQNGTAYDRVSFLPERREMMQTWADYLDSLKVRRADG